MKPLSFTFCLQFLLIAMSIPTCFCRMHPNDEKLIEQTCKNTPNYNLCIKYLKSDPQSSTADITGLSLIMVRAIESIAKQNLVLINQLLKESPQMEALSQCVNRYNAIILVDVPSAILALQIGNPIFAEHGVTDAFIEANACENNFSGHSPLTPENNAMGDVANVARSIIWNLL